MLILTTRITTKPSSFLWTFLVAEVNSLRVRVDVVKPPSEVKYITITLALESILAPRCYSHKFLARIDYNFKTNCWRIPKHWHRSIDILYVSNFLFFLKFLKLITFNIIFLKVTFDLKGRKLMKVDTDDYKEYDSNHRNDQGKGKPHG